MAVCVLSIKYIINPTYPQIIFRADAAIQVSEKTVEFFHLTCYDVTYVGRTYQFRLQRLRWGVHTVVDSFRGCLVRLL